MNARARARKRKRDSATDDQPVAPGTRDEAVEASDCEQRRIVGDGDGAGRQEPHERRCIRVVAIESHEAGIVGHGQLAIDADQPQQ